MKNYVVIYSSLKRVISLALVFTISIQLIAQGGKINLKLENKPLKTVLSEIEKQSEYTFVYSPNSINSDQSLNFSATNESAESVVKRLCGLLSLNYSINGKQITLSVGSSESKKQSQNKFSLKGTVRDKTGEPVIAAYVLLGGSNTGTSTDAKGEFSIDAKRGDILEIYAMSYKTSKIIVTSSSVLNIQLEDDAFNLDELLVVGYGTIKKSDVTGSVASIKSEDLTKQAVLSADQALQGRLPGVQVTSNSGSPGGAVSVNIRGIGTVNDSQPLYVVDGMPVNSISYLNTNDIASMEVLKDASASAIYGSRGANGVILITTHKGKTGESKISFSGYSGVQNMLNNSEFVNNTQWYDLQTKLNVMRTTPVDLSKADININTDWLKEISRVAAIHNYYLEVSGGKEDITYSASGGYFSQDGIIKGTSMDRMTLRLNGESKVRKYLTIGTNLSYSQSSRTTIDENGESWGVLSTAVRLEPTVPVKNTDGSFGFSPFVDINNPVATIYYSDAKTKAQNIVGNAYLKADITKDLYFRTSYGVDMLINDVYNFIPVYEVSPTQKNSESKISRGYEKTVNWLWESTLNFNRTFLEKHNIQALAGYTMENTRMENLYGSKNGVPADLPSLKYIDAAQNAGSAAVTGTAWESAMISYLGRINYSYDDRYLATVSVRSDGSSKFSKSNRYALFPSFSLAWKITNEKFFKNFKLDFIDDLKFRAGWGEIGNQNIGNYKFLSVLTNYAQYRYIFGSPETLYQGITAVNMANDKIKWETSESVNVGLDIILFKGLNITADYFVKNTKDMLLTEPIPMFLGFENGPVTNVGSVRNSGIELAAIWRGALTKEFTYSAGFNFTSIRNRVTSLGHGGSLSGASVYNKGNATNTIVGYPIGMFWGYETAGLIQTQEQLTEVRTKQPSAQLGDVIFKDPANKTMIGNPMPDFTYGINLSCAYKGIELSAFFDGVYGNEIFNASRAYTYNTSSTFKNDIAILNYWTPTNTNTNIPRLTPTDSNDNMRISDRYIENGSYFRLKNLQLAYNIPSAIVSKLKITGIRIFVSGQNLFTVTKYTGMYPEIGQAISTSYLSRGVDYGNYPQSKIVTGGISINF
jgi:TonB-linked SusC/RagA family outer membrane protein